MPVAGEEGYGRLVICPFDKAHEISLARLQFHLSKCSKNFPDTDSVKCPFNSTHNIPYMELEFHIQECKSRAAWDRGHYRIGNDDCPVKDLVPVNAATVPEADESWDDYENKSSVLDSIKVFAEEKKILRNVQCGTKSQRKAFRKTEQVRHRNLEKETSSATPASGSSESTSGRLRKPPKPTVVSFKTQDPASAIKNLETGMKNVSLNSSNNYTPIHSTSTTSHGTSPKALPLNSVSASPRQDSLMDQSDGSYLLGKFTFISSKSSPVCTASARAPRSYAGIVGSRSSENTSTSNSCTSNFPFNTRRHMTSPIEISANSRNDGFSQIPTPGSGRGRGVLGHGPNIRMSKNN